MFLSLKLPDLSGSLGEVFTSAAEIQVDAGFPKLEWNTNQHNWVQVNKAKSKNGDATNVLLKMESQSSRAVIRPGSVLPASFHQGDWEPRWGLTT